MKVGWLAAGVPAALLTALPSCPACYPLYAAVLASIGLTVDPGLHLALTAVLGVAVLGVLGFRAPHRIGHGPLVLGLAAALVLATGKWLLHSEELGFAGAAALTVAAVWNAWPQRRAAPGCPACASDAALPAERKPPLGG